MKLVVIAKIQQEDTTLEERETQEVSLALHQMYEIRTQGWSG